MSKKIIISNYDDIHNPVYGGGGAYAVHEVAKRFAVSYDVTVITGIYDGAANKNVDGVKYERIGTSIFGLKFGQLIYQLILPFYLITKKFDVWIESFTPPTSTAFLPLFTRKPVVGLVHMLAARDMERKYKLPFRFIENLGLKFYKYFIVLSNDTRKKIMINNKNAKFVVVPNGVNMPKKQIKKSKALKYLLYIGRIEVDQKGLDKLVESFDQVHRVYPELKLKIAGTGSSSELELLQTLIANKSLQKSIHLIGRVEGKAKEKIMENASVIVIPSRFETFSLTALEALAHGIPIACFNISGMKWLNGIYVSKAKRFSSNALAKNILSLIKRSNTNIRISSEARKAASHYDWDIVMNKYRSLIEQLA